jgi:hypothetical protein
MILDLRCKIYSILNNIVIGKLVKSKIIFLGKLRQDLGVVESP